MKHASKTMIKQAAALVLVALALAQAACSNQRREANFDVDYDEVTTLLANVQGTLGAGGSQARGTFFELAEDPASTLFYATASVDGGPFGYPVNVLSVGSYEFLGPDLAPLNYPDIAVVSVVFAFQPGAGGDRCALMVDVQPLDSETAYTRFFECTGAGVDGGEFVADLDDGDGHQIVLRSWDTADGYLTDVIQLRVSDLINGEEYPNGKFSTLIGFVPQ